jgi:hypothetical protein
VTTPQEQQPAQPAPAPTVSTVPPASRRRIPAHLGPARTSTVILAVLWLALGALYLNVRPESPETASRSSTVQTTDPARTATAPPAPTTAPATTTTATTTGTATTTAETTTAETTTSTPAITGTSEPTASEPTTTPPPTTAVPLPPTTTPTG